MSPETEELFEGLTYFTNIHDEHGFSAFVELVGNFRASAIQFLKSYVHRYNIYQSRLVKNHPEDSAAVVSLPSGSIQQTNTQKVFK